ncbi:MAG: RDD family protein [Anaerolineales bacterium]|nr:RDD family protein [Anaerolineales bacterium]
MIVLKTVIENSDTKSTNVQYAGFTKRLKAFTYDYLFIFGYIIILLGTGISITLALGPLEQISSLFASTVFLEAMSFVVLILPVILYFTLQESSPRQGTWGKRKTGLRVVNFNGERLTRKQAFVRALVKFLPWQIAHTSIYQIQTNVPGKDPSPLNIAGFVLVYVLVGIYITSALISKKQRTPYDWVAGSYVIVVN